MGVAIKVNGAGLLNYAKAGREAVGVEVRSGRVIFHLRRRCDGGWR